MSRRLIGPFSRVEGHLEITLERKDAQITRAEVNSPMFRGMETVMLNRPAMDALTIAPRICGICSVAQSVAAAQALAQISEIKRPRNGELVTNLILACEMLSNHLTHFYTFFMADFARATYKTQPWFDKAQQFKAQTGRTQINALEARNQLLHIMGVLAGKWPHTLTLHPSGTTQTVKTTEKLKLKTIIASFRRFLERNVFDCPLEAMMSLKSYSAVQNWAMQTKGDLSLFLEISQSLNLDKAGQTSSLMISGGGLDGLFQQGCYTNSTLSNLPVDQIVEDISHSFMDGEQRQTPFEGSSKPLLDKDEAYSWCKAPRLDEQRAEVGALARQLANKQSLFQDIYAKQTSSVESRVFARVWEMAQITLMMEKWITEIDPNDTFYLDTPLAQTGQTISFIEAARGTLGHWVNIEDGIIKNYQIIAPTTWNFSPRDHNQFEGPLENALVGTLINDDDPDPVMVQHIVRSFDPCMACTVH